MQNSVDVLIVTALKMEFEAAREAMTARDGRSGVVSWSTSDGPDTAHYLLGDYTAPGSRALRIALARPTRKGATLTAAIASALVERLKPRCLAMAGVCAGDPNHVALGDVVVAEMTYAYDEGKVAKEGFEGDHRQWPISETWLRAAQELTTKGLPSFGEASQEDAEFWLLEQLYNGRDPRQHPARIRYFSSMSWMTTVQNLESRGLLERVGPNLVLTKAGCDTVENSLVLNLDPPATLPFAVHVGPIASGNVVVKDGVTWAKLQRLGVSSVLGLEMETAAIGAVAHSTGTPEWVVAKGVMDHADHTKDDRYKRFAARASAEVLMRLLLQQLLASAPTQSTTGPNILAVEKPRRPLEFGGKTEQEIKHDRDVRNLRRMLSEVSTGLIDQHLNRMPEHFFYSAVVMSDILYGFLQSNNFRLYDDQLYRTIEDVSCHLLKSFTAEPFYTKLDMQRGFQHLTHNHNPAYAAERAAAMQSTNEGLNALRESLTAFTLQIRQNYIEIELEEANKEAWNKFKQDTGYSH